MGQFLGKKYEKSDSTVFDLLKDKTETAKKNSRKLLDQYGDKLIPEKDNPSTNLHELVIVLEKLRAV